MWGQPNQPGQPGSNPFETVEGNKWGATINQWGNQGGNQPNAPNANQGFGPSSVGAWTLTAEKHYDIREGTIDISEVVPINAREVKLFLDVEAGYNKEDRSTLITITTDQDKAKLRVHVFGQNAWSFNSDNISLFLGEKKVHFRFDGHKNPFEGGNGTIKMTVLGYK